MAADAKRDDAPAVSEPSTSALGAMERHHYSIDARVRPLIMFWITSHDVGDAEVTRRHEKNGAGYSLLIGSDPERAPRAINRWGYLAEDVHGAQADLVGLMTESEEQSIQQAEASITRASAQRTYEFIHATVDGDRGRSVVTSFAAPASYTLRQASDVLTLARRSTGQSRERDVRVPDGTQPGFLSALADMMDRQIRALHVGASLTRDAAVRYVYHGRIYQLRTTNAAAGQARVGAMSTDAITAEFEIRNGETGEVTPFSMAFGTSGRFVCVPLVAAYQPRWWLRIELTLRD
jgi:hypothetical protein